jgi:hypothetical protein
VRRLPLEASTGLVPASAAKDASLVRHPALEDDSDLVMSAGRTGRFG